MRHKTKFLARNIEQQLCSIIYLAVHSTTPVRLSIGTQIALVQKERLYEV